MNETALTIVGNLTAEPELRQTQSGVAVASFTIASTPRSFDRQANEWKDGEALFMRCSAWRDLATNITASLTKGSRVIASGRLQQRSYQDREGNSRVSMELQIDEIGPSLKYATAQVARGDRSGGGAAPVSAAPTSTAPAAAATDSWSTPNAEWSVSDETPF
ncbi:single-stranded DNA-binding protein [Microbacterium sp. A84]|uniref:single-stranded DNA-binding protein n=1 Tax=Microbacterium sp. A84 TaxID=3450715 RepID=UPI003F434D5B